MKNLTKNKMNEVATDLMMINLYACVTDSELKYECRSLANRMLNAELSLIAGCRCKEATKRVENNLVRVGAYLEDSLNKIGCVVFGNEITEIFKSL